MASPSSSVDAATACNLRCILRLIHCLQRERGASCALAGTGSGVLQNNEAANECIRNSLQRYHNVRAARSSTNAAIATFYRIEVLHTSSCGVASKLAKVRLLVDEQPSPRHLNEKYQIVHSVVKEFGSLLYNIIQVYLIENITRRQELDNFNQTSCSTQQQEEATALLTLLLTFVELKESLGIERASLTGIMVIGNDMKSMNDDAESSNDEMGMPGLPLMINDVVMVVENQNRVLADLQRQSGVSITEHVDSEEAERSSIMLDPNLLRLIGESIKLSDEMQRLQDHIRKDFDMNGFHQEMTMDEFWARITIYMDTLHSMELLILEELDQCDNRQDDLDLLTLKTNITNKIPESNIAKTLGKPNVHEDHGLREWEISLYDVEFQKRIGRGAAGTTYMAKWMGQRVAVKVASISDLGVDGWRTELSSLKQLHHPNIVRFMGAIFNPSPLTYCLVLEYCEEDLADALQKATPSGFFAKVALDIASGLWYLHQKNIIHRDIKPSNCLLQGDVKGHYTAKLTDFGLAACVSLQSSHKELTGETGTYRYMAPEVIRSEPYQFSADVYSFGLLLWELVTHEPHGPIEAAGLVAIQSQRPPFPSGIPITLKTVIERCWIDSPENRMSLPSVIEWLEHIQDHLSKESVMWLNKPCGHPVYNITTGVLRTSPKEHKKKISALKNTLFGKNKRNDTFDRHG